MDTRDTGAARSFLAGQAKHAGAHASSYRGRLLRSLARRRRLRPRRALRRDRQRGRAASGDRRHAGRSGALGGPGLLEARRGAAPSEAIAHLYVSPGRGAAAGGGRRRLLEALGGARQTYVSADRPVELAARSTSTRSPRRRPERTRGCSRPTPRPRRRSRELPGESWLAIGIGHAGSTLAGTTAVLSALGVARGLRRGRRRAQPRLPARRADAAAARPRRPHGRGAPRLHLLDGLRGDLRGRLERARTAGRRGRSPRPTRQRSRAAVAQARRGPARRRRRGRQGQASPAPKRPRRCGCPACR